MSSDKDVVQMNSETQPVPENASARDAHDSLRRHALNFSLLGGIAAFLAACGKSVSKFDKRSDFVGSKSTKDGDALGKSGSSSTGGSGSSGDGSGTGDGSGQPPDGGMDPGGGGTAPGGLKPGTCLPVSVQIVDTTPNAATGITVDNAAIASFNFYQGNSSKLLALKFASGKAAEGDFVHLVGKMGAAENSGKILATRRVLSTDIRSGIAYVSFETLALMKATHIDVILVSTSKNTKVKQTIEVAYKNKLDGLDVVDLCYSISTAQAMGNLFDHFQFGGDKAPTMDGTSTIGSPAASLGEQTGGTAGGGKGATYKIANGNSTWNVSNLFGSEPRVENLFGESVNIGTATASNVLASEHTFAAYFKRNYNGKDYYVRYFFFIG